MDHAAAKKLLARATAVLLVVVAHAFLLNLAHPATPALGFAYAVSFLCLALGAGLLWYRTMD
jgi:hypothetical protein